MSQSVIRMSVTSAAAPSRRTVGHEGGDTLVEVGAAVHPSEDVVALDVAGVVVEPAAELLGRRYRQRGATRHLVHQVLNEAVEVSGEDHRADETRRRAPPPR